MLKAVKRARGPNASSMPRSSTQAQDSRESNRSTETEPAQFSGSSQTTSSNLEAPDWKTRMKSAFMSVDQKLRDWWARKPTSLRTSPLEQDVEQQLEHHTNSAGDSREEHSDGRPELRLPVASGAEDEPRPRSGGSNSGVATRVPEPDPVSPQQERPGRDELPGQEQDPSEMEDQSRISRQKPHPPKGNLSDYLVRGYSAPEKRGLELRRTLDQYAYADVKTTSHRDNDQVIYRYTEDGSKGEPKIFMVDQMWLWVLGRGT